MLRMKEGGIKEKGALWERIRATLIYIYILKTELIGKTIKLDCVFANLLHSFKMRPIVLLNIMVVSAEL